MFSGLATKLALKKVGLSADSFNFSSPAAADPAPSESKAKGGKSKNNGADADPNGDFKNDDEQDASPWPAWMTVKSLPLSVQPWLAPPPPPIPLAELPKVGDQAPMDRDRRIAIGGGRCVMIVFLRCVGCAFAQKTFLSLRTLANRFPNDLTCIAVSHSSAAATQKWVDLMGGSWNVQIVIDEDRSVYAAWGLGLGTVWSVLNPTTQIQAWKEKGWLGNQVATAIQRKGTAGRGMASYQTGGSGVIDVEGPVTVMGNKWQNAGAWAVNGSGVIVWGKKAATADDLLDLDDGCKALGL